MGPGNRWVAAKHLVSGRVGIDMLGPGELVLAADGADPAVIAADLLAQAEHDPDARPIVVTSDPALVAPINAASKPLATLSTADIARAALQNGGIVLCDDTTAVVAAVNALAPSTRAPGPCPNPGRGHPYYGGLFVGAGAAEVLGDYGMAPITSCPPGTARFSGGLGVFDFVRIRTWMRIDAPADAQGLVADADAAFEGRGPPFRSAALVVDMRRARAPSISCRSMCRAWAASSLRHRARCWRRGGRRLPGPRPAWASPRAGHRPPPSDRPYFLHNRARGHVGGRMLDGPRWPSLLVPRVVGHGVIGGVLLGDGHAEDRAKSPRRGPRRSRSSLRTKACCSRSPRGPARRSRC